LGLRGEAEGNCTMRSFTIRTAEQSILVIKSMKIRSRARGIWGDNGIMDAYVVLLGKLREKDNFEDTAFMRR